MAEPDREEAAVALIGPFFYVRGELIYNACPLSEGRRQADKIDNSYGHDRLWDDRFPAGDYIFFPRGRVVWDVTGNRSVIYIDRCIRRKDVPDRIVSAFEIGDYVVLSDDHYRCRNCMGDPFAD